MMFWSQSWDYSLLFVHQIEDPGCLWGRVLKGSGIQPDSSEEYDNLSVKMNLFYHEFDLDVQKLKPAELKEGLVHMTSDINNLYFVPVSYLSQFLLSLGFQEHSFICMFSVAGVCGVQPGSEELVSGCGEVALSWSSGQPGHVLLSRLWRSH